MLISNSNQIFSSVNGRQEESTDPEKSACDHTQKKEDNVSERDWPRVQITKSKVKEKTAIPTPATSSLMAWSMV